MSRLTLKNIPPDYFNDKVVLPHPSLTPEGYRFLLTHSQLDWQYVMSYKNEHMKTTDKGATYYTGTEPDLVRNIYKDYDIYEKLPDGYIPTKHVSKLFQQIRITEKIINEGFEITENNIIPETISVLLNEKNIRFRLDLNKIYFSVTMNDIGKDLTLGFNYIYEG